MPSYEIRIVFESDRELTEDEKGLLAGACEAQIAEPADENGNDMNVNIKNHQVFLEQMEN
jgi:hypothetical protein